MRLIDADKLRYSQRYARADPDSDKLIPVYAIDHRQVDEAPTVDAVPVVRCRDCRYYIGFVCSHPGGMTFASDADYCSLSQRRDQSAEVRNMAEAEP